MKAKANKIYTFLQKYNRPFYLTTVDPLGCPVAINISDYRLMYNSHKGLHPNSTKCYWSGKEVDPNQEVELHWQ